MSDPVLDGLRQTEASLLAELEGVPAYQMLKDVRGLINRRTTLFVPRGSVGRVPVSADSGRALTVAAIVTDAAEDFLRKINRRAQTPEIAEEVKRRGIQAGNPENIIATVSSYLSSNKSRFDNVRGEGYGLVEWSNGANLEPLGPESGGTGMTETEVSAEKVGLFEDSPKREAYVSPFIVNGGVSV